MKLEIHIHNHNHGLEDIRVFAAIREIKEMLMATQEQLDQLATQIEEAKTTITSKIAEETAQVQEFIASHPDLDTTKLESAVSNLNGLGDAVSGIFPDAPPATEPPAEEPPPPPATEPPADSTPTDTSSTDTTDTTSTDTADTTDTPTDGSPTPEG